MRVCVYACMRARVCVCEAAYLTMFQDYLKHPGPAKPKGYSYILQL